MLGDGTSGVHFICKKKTSLLKLLSPRRDIYAISGFSLSLFLSLALFFSLSLSLACSLSLFLSLSRSLSLSLSLSHSLCALQCASKINGGQFSSSKDFPD